MDQLLEKIDVVFCRMLSDTVWTDKAHIEVVVSVIGDVVFGACACRLHILLVCLSQIKSIFINT